MASPLLIFALLTVPVAGAVACLVTTRPRQVATITIAVSAIVLAIAAWLGTAALSGNRSTVAGGMFVVDAFAGFHLIVLALVFLICSLFASIYFADDDGGAHPFSRGPARRFGGLWLGSLAAMILVLVSNNLGIMWVGMEATTLLTAFLISFYRDRLSLEAMWKYLLICSVGIAFAFIGTIFTAAAVQSGSGVGADALLWTRLAAPDTRLDPTLMTFAFIFVLVGYGTKAGLAPLHSWLPDAHSQAPAPVSAMFSGFLLNTALYCIMRFVPAARHALGGFADGLLVFFGVLSVLVAAGFIIFQRDAKRFLAYSSVEHLGIIALGYGLGPLGAFAALFHTLNHSLSKTLAFCAVGRLGQRFGTHDMEALSGALRHDRLWGLALVGSVLSLIGAAPFAIFMSEYQLLRAAAGAQKWVVLAVFLTAASVVFVSALRHLIDMAFGDAKVPVSSLRVRATGFAVAMLPLAALLLLGLWLPPWLVEAIGRAAAALGAPA